MPRDRIRLPIDRLAPRVRICVRARSMVHGLGDRWLADHELLFFQRGRGVFRIDGVDHVIEPGVLIALEPGVLHAFSPPVAEAYAFLSLHFDPWPEPGRERLGHVGSPRSRREAERWLPPGVATAEVPCRVLLREPRLYERLFDAVHRRFPMRDLVMTGAPLPSDPAERLRLSAAASELLAFVIAEGAAPGPRLTPAQRAAAEQAAALLDARAEPLPLTALARRVGLSRTHLARCFALRYGVGPIGWHLRQRIARAQAELARGRSIKEVTARLGFPSVHRFTRCFARVAGLPPAAWRTLRERGVAELVPPAP